MSQPYIFKLAISPKEIKDYFDLRRAIFVEEQDVFEEDDLDDIDKTAYPIVAIETASDRVVGVVRIYETQPRLWYGGRLGTHPELQNVRFFQRLHWESLNEITICDRPHHLMEADLNFYPAAIELCPSLLWQSKKVS